MPMPTTTTDPIPVRALNQLTYCPRLFYLQYVDCVMPTNEHVERVAVESTDALRHTTREAITRCRELQVLDAPPEPLPAELRHRCFGCSLAPVCLPEEILYQIGHPKPTAGDAEAPPQIAELKKV